jgi:hypothetical protein
MFIAVSLPLGDIAESLKVLLNPVDHRCSYNSNFGVDVQTYLYEMGMKPTILC